MIGLASKFTDKIIDYGKLYYVNFLLIFGTMQNKILVFEYIFA